MRAAAFLGIASAIAPLGCGGDPSDRPDVLLVVVDTLRADHVGAYGYARATTPNVDGLAGTATRFEVGLASAPWTGPSIATLFTGLHGSSHGLLTCSAPLGGEVLPGDFLAPGNVTLAESLSDAGYATAGVTSNPWLRERYGYAQGFDTFDELPNKSAAAPVTERAISRYEEMRRSGDGPIFLYVHYMDAHGPYEPDPPYDTMFERGDGRRLSDAEWEAMEPYLRLGESRDLSVYVDRYDGGIRQCDEQIGRLLQALGPRLSRTVVVFTADHGEEFFEHGRAGHGYSLFEEMLRIPLVIRVPGREPSVVPAPEFAALVDLAPTLLSLADVDYAEDRFDGRDLFADGAPPPLVAWAENHSKGSRLVARRRPDAKAIFALGAPTLLAFLDLVMDPRETKDLRSFLPAKIAESERAAVGAFVASCEARRRRVTKGFVPPAVAADPADKDDLRKLGYVK